MGTALPLPFLDDGFVVGFGKERFKVEPEAVFCGRFTVGDETVKVKGGAEGINEDLLTGVDDAMVAVEEGMENKAAAAEVSGIKVTAVLRPGMETTGSE